MLLYYFLFLFDDAATTEIYTYRHTLSLHDALPISPHSPSQIANGPGCAGDRSRLSQSNWSPWRKSGSMLSPRKVIRTKSPGDPRNSPSISDRETNAVSTSPSPVPPPPAPA